MSKAPTSVAAEALPNTGIAHVTGEGTPIKVVILRDGAAEAVDIGQSYIAVEGDHWRAYRVVSAKAFAAEVRARNPKEKPHAVD